MNRKSIAGKMLRFTFADGPMAGKTFEHLFEPSGAVRYRQVDGTGEGTTEKKYEAAPIGSDVWVGGGAILCPGVTVGSRTVIGAGSVVTRDIPAGVLAVGNPCRVIREIQKGDQLTQR